MDEDYLVHYGVLGMKWGVRKARKKGTSYSYTSMRTKHLAKKAARAKAKGKKNAKEISERLKRSKKIDENLLIYAKKTSVGKAIVQDILLGPGGAKSYQTMRANGTSRGAALAFQAVSKTSAFVIGNFIGQRVGPILGRQITNALGLNSVPVPKQMEIYNQKMQELIGKAIEYDQLLTKKGYLLGRSRRSPYSSMIESVPKNRNYGSLLRLETIEKFEKKVSKLVLQWTDDEVKRLIKQQRIEKAIPIEKFVKDFMISKGPEGYAYLIGTKIKDRSK